MGKLVVINSNIVKSFRESSNKTLKYETNLFSSETKIRNDTRRASEARGRRI